MDNQKGFTLFELAGVLLILSILSGIGIPLITQLQNRILFRSEVSSLFIDLQRAKIAAIKNNAPVVITTSSNGYQIYVDNGFGHAIYGDWKKQPEEQLLAEKTLRGGITITKHFTGKRCRFNSGIGIKGGTIELTDRFGNKSRIIINIVGRIRVQKL